MTVCNISQSIRYLYTCLLLEPAYALNVLNTKAMEAFSNKFVHFCFLARALTVYPQRI